MSGPVRARGVLRAGAVTASVVGMVAGMMAGLAACTTPPAPPAPLASITPLAPPATIDQASMAPATALSPLPESEQPPPEPREFRAAWVATVANIDWPSAPGLTAAVQQAQALALLDRAQALGLNALILQVRPSGDAIYPSALEPWTEYLSGTQGRPPWAEGEAAWDPLAFWLREARARGLELHAWLNPYRARHSAAKSPPVAPHLAVTAPGLVRSYGDMLWMDPAEPAAAAHTLAVVADLLRRYDVDGVHIDDYFYPYPIPIPVAGSPAPTPGTPVPEQPFPDDGPWARYLARIQAQTQEQAQAQAQVRSETRSGTRSETHAGTQAQAQTPGTVVPLSREDWRRAHVDRLVQDLYRTAQATRPGVRVGISPFGLPRPDLRPPGIAGFSQYDKLYADVEKWFAAGWLDYLAPQLYWPIDRTAQAFPVLLDSWVGLNTAGRHLWPGLFTSLTTRGEPLGPRSWPAREVLDQVGVVRSRNAGGAGGSGGTGGTGGTGGAAPAATPVTPGAVPVANPGSTGHIHFSMVALMQDRDGLATALQAGAYAQPALVPATPWLDATPPPAPVLALVQGPDGVQLQIEPGAGEAAARWAVWRRVNGGWRFAVLPGATRQLAVDAADAVVVSAVDRGGNSSARNAVQLTRH